jgi:hypothetical protein
VVVRAPRIVRFGGGLVTLAVVVGCGSGSGPKTTPPHASAARPVHRTLPTPRPRSPDYPVVLTAAARPPARRWVAVVRVGGRAAAWLATRGAVTLARFDQRLLRLALHAGTLDPGGSGWRYGPAIGPRGRRWLVAAFNGGFRLSTGAGGFVASGRAVVPLRAGVASIVTYSDGVTAVGAWDRQVPARGARVVSVRQNLDLLVDGGRPTPSALSCGSACWGATLGGGTFVARSGLGIDRRGRLVWAAGEALSPAALAQALAGAGTVRAAELDINPEWVAGYLYRHGRHGQIRGVLPVVPGQAGIPGQFLAPYSRDFFTILTRSPR